ncbi:UDP-N-acetylglucosamine--N-acetylmuramyl-(pentapeptide) pyrophosphoryl-undecaprenol N-acetylglucosamine transferase [Streptomyces griseiscabiei]|uniref:UDP-N-acetylglucosamine--N-acetylmuramyl-(pentapeptide) pyrophosphoryl-undecaprenol N-acetylglucosamine transferase n=1 Tax=Streptomyces griseiscabiei TaxID=2993540 RepID=A0ABU4LK61_9ACTN|nr:UDP-N-acetylglucosamine--N-acetylmuramyl-(pentapeptide) pyrophosphoryl-undecaprenol N-acetylglucosamine transferase [Streptomyces griseiscabiei]MBZ3906532.1 UDP-N-acetylglucosamine--N-acetylmuramyl-(pentapeptide) pyrophosphoryl-undecaprenol N-acetylglucosamine transferase [Streptomyces griseiscabiei]MDX2916176.1 UDP-N-acetylglucosamine--N-acetylmuramyl-(pentapeptide) pyrophosphoryl-undecaprenol N-acetylglucosamine transferase [Streptomyces griseiscabiei]
MKIAITGGGSAGHVVPALSVATQLTQSGNELVFLGRHGSIEHEYAQKANIRFRSVPSAGLKRYGSWSNIRMPFTVLRGIAAARRAMHHERPDAVFSKGGYVTVPVGIAAWLCRVPVVIHESDHSLGLANRILARMAARVCLSEPARSKPPRWLARKTVVTGLPLRHDLGDGNPGQLRSRLGIRPGAEVLLIFCGSSGSARINDAVRSQLNKLLGRFAVIHVCGKGNLDPALEATAGYWQFEYLHQEMTDALWLADLVIGRAGATTLAELEALGKRAVLIPLPASVSRGDQLVNAEAYARRHEGRCHVIQDDDALTGGAALVAACLHLADAHASFRRPDPAVIHQAASRIAEQTLAAARPRSRRAR